MDALLILVICGVALARHRRRHRQHEPRLVHLLGSGGRVHGPTCGCEACLENYAETPA